MNKPCQHRKKLKSGKVRCDLLPAIKRMNPSVCAACEKTWTGGPPEAVDLNLLDIEPTSEPKPERRRPCLFLGEPTDKKPCCGGRSYRCDMLKKNVTLATCRGCDSYEAS